MTEQIHDGQDARYYAQYDDDVVCDVCIGW
jgi:hypothetical protein